MSEPAIGVRGVGKRYRVVSARGKQARYQTLREALSSGAAELVQRFGSRLGGNGVPAPDGVIWALRDVSFDVQPGEVLGIIGGNGAGKSTLLKILSRVTKPTTGRVELRGRVGSLLEVGTGFHPELTGRENIFLSGAILGMRHAEIRRKFGDIVEFAGVERFIDTPVKRYSSGMYLRLAFAVAAHLEPEILLVDEVLAVGDAAFQRKCLGKMDDVAKEGRTVLFVSHNMDAVQRLCPRTLLIQHGQVLACGDSTGVVTRYLASDEGRANPPDRWIDLSSARRRGTGEARFVAARYSSGREEFGCHAYSGGPLEFTLEVTSIGARTVESLAVILSTRSGTKLINADTIARGINLRLVEGRNIVRLRLEQLPLNPGVYVIGLWLSRSPGAILDFLQSAFDVEVVPTAARALGATPQFDGVVACNFDVSLDVAEMEP
jgi:lipopolysaccharide transport system ATP-binding protein